ncbi:MAG: UDP-3-O-(3-hydroxymyristoyl)glucosamine N-acyltransferase [Pseudobdellovibrionaceae bacterium]
MDSSTLISAEKIAQICLDPIFSTYLQIVKSSPQAKAKQVVEPSQTRPETLCFVSTPELLSQALKGHPSIIVALDQLLPSEIQIGEHQALFSTPNISAAMALVLPLFDQKLSRFPMGIHPTASVDPSARIGKDVRIGAFTVVGPDVEIGDSAVLASHVVVEKAARIGARTLLHSFVFVGANCSVGKLCEIHPHTCIGSDGFGFVQGKDQRRHKIPQLGTVVIEDLVEMGANCAVDRSTLGETRIGEGSKFDNLCHIGHNCRIGKNNVFAAGFLMAGSCQIGDNCMFGGSTVLSDHVTVGSSIVVGGRSAITKDTLKPGAYNGYPLEPFRDSLKTLANLTHLTSMRKQLTQIRRHLGLEKESE